MLELQEYRVVDMYTKASLPHMKEKVLATFRVLGSTLRIVIATTAFSMVIDCPDVHRVFHYGPPCSKEEYIQETGRAGRDDNQSSAVLLYGKPSKYVNKDVRYYGENTEICHRQLLFQELLCIKHGM